MIEAITKPKQVWHQGKLSCMASGKTIADYNLAVLFPNLVNEWDFEKNETINPYTMAPKSSKKIYWKCEYGHSWNAAIRDRTQNNANCPKCSGRQATDQTCIATVKPYLIKYWNCILNEDKTPHNICAHSHLDIYFICPLNPEHSWKRKPADIIKETGCPHCSKQEISKSYNFAEMHPEWLKYWSPENAEKPENIFPQSHKIFIWQCSKNELHKWRSSPKQFCATKSKCPICREENKQAKQCLVHNIYKQKDACRLCHKENDLLTKNVKTLYPHLAEQWNIKLNNGIAPELIIAQKSDKKYWWDCQKCNLSWEARLSSRIGGSQCPYCSHQIIIFKNSLAGLYPDLMNEWHPHLNDLDPSTIGPHSSFYAHWICQENHIWKARIGSRTSKEPNGCPHCACKNSSKNEKQIALWLEKYEISFEEQKRFNSADICKFRFDFYLPEHNICIEYDGEAHFIDSNWYKGDRMEKRYSAENYINIQRRDEYKNEYCKNNNIDLLRIPYTDKNNINNILYEKLIKEKI